jgi:hypothetical protein
VNLIAPGFVGTPLAANALDDQLDSRRGAHEEAADPSSHRPDRHRSARPSPHDQFVHQSNLPTTSESFPSGWVARVIVIYGFIAFLYLHLRRWKSWGISVFVWTFVVLFAFLEGYARAALLLHWPFDIRRPDTRRVALGGDVVGREDLRRLVLARRR